MVIGLTSASTSDGAFKIESTFISPPDGSATIGGAHGDVAVSPTGEIYVSVEEGEHPGIQVYSADGRYIRNVPNVPTDLHGFVIASSGESNASIFGASLLGQRILKISLTGEILLEIPSTAIPDEFKTIKNDESIVSLTGVVVAPNGDIYAVDGYGRDFIHRFDKGGRYIDTFGGRDGQWGFRQCHRIAIDPRFEPVRLLCTDRLHNRVVQMDLSGRVLGVLAKDLDWPGALATYRDELAVGNLGGTVVIFDREGRRVATIGRNANSEEVKTNNISPDRWRPDVFYAPHGVAYTSEGNLLVTEWSRWGRLVRIVRH